MTTNHLYTKDEKHALVVAMLDYVADAFKLGPAPALVPDQDLPLVTWMDGALLELAITHDLPLLDAMEYQREFLMRQTDPYITNGFNTREEYLKDLAVANGISEETVFALADLLGPDEDFDGLVTEIEDMEGIDPLDDLGVLDHLHGADGTDQEAL